MAGMESLWSKEDRGSHCSLLGSGFPTLFSDSGCSIWDSNLLTNKAEDDLEPVILWTPSPKCGDFRSKPPHPVYKAQGIAQGLVHARQLLFSVLRPQLQVGSYQTMASPIWIWIVPFLRSPGNCSIFQTFSCGKEVG